MAMVPTTASYTCKIAALLENQAYRMLKKDPPESVECTNILLLKKYSCSVKHGSPYHVKNSEDINHTVDSACTEPQNIMAIFNIVSLFTTMLIKEAISFLRRYFEDGLRLFCHVLTSLHFSFNSQLYHLTDSMVMGLPLSPIAANFFVKDLKKNGI
jgi:hypothetical protein